jgi:transcriptional regulator with XRE-family HTH domain
MDDEQTDGERIREYRERLGYSQDDLAMLLGVHRVTLNRWEQDKAKPPPYLLQYLSLILPKEDD